MHYRGRQSGKLIGQTLFFKKIVLNIVKLGKFIEILGNIRLETRLYEK